MLTRLKRGRCVTRVVPSRLRECRAGELVVTLDNELGVPSLILRPLKSRQRYGYMRPEAHVIAVQILEKLALTRTALPAPEVPRLEYRGRT